ncbi:MAG: AEC family transporter [Spongiibacteraceae bacterium]
MSALLLLVVCLALGVTVARLVNAPPTLAQNLNWWVLNIALPALILHLMPSLQIDWHLWFLPASMWFVFLGAWGFFALVGHWLKWSREQIGCLTLLCGLGNTSFIGFPMVEALRGQEGLTLAAVADQLGSFPCLVIGGTIVAALYSGGKPQASVIVRKILLFPPFGAFVLGLIAGQLGGWPLLLDEIFTKLGATLVPLALFSVGLQLRLRLAPGQMTAAMIGLTWKMGIAAAIIGASGLLLGIDRSVHTIAVLETAMAPMISAGILAEQNDLDPPLANAVLSIGILLSFLTVPLVNLFF